MYKKNKGYFVVLNHKYVPKTGTMNKEFEVHEECEFVDRIKDRMLNVATVIIDVENRILLKNRAKEQGATYEDFINHCRKTYKEKFSIFEDFFKEKTGKVVLEKQEDTENAIEEISDKKEIDVKEDGEKLKTD